MSKCVLSRVLLPITLATLVGWSFALMWVSSCFTYARDVLDKPVLMFVGLQVAAGGLYLLVVALVWRRPSTRGLLLAIVITGVIMRLAQFGALPVLEDDFYRYLWDGAVVAHGHNPYLLSPEQVRIAGEDVPDNLSLLGEASGPVIERVNHPALRSIYPPTAQAAFAVGYWISPFDIQGLRWVWMGLDLLVLVVLLDLLRTHRSPALGVGIYWLNPLLIKEVFNAGHMELVLVLTLLLTLAVLRRGMHKPAGVFLGLATGAKLWPVLWLPFLLRGAATSIWRRLAVALAFLGPAALLALPVALGRLDPQSGFTAYAQRWQMNDSAYLLIHELAKLIWLEEAQLIARLMVGALLLGVMAVAWRYIRSGYEGFVSSAAAVTIALLLLSPTQFPWYYLWVLPLLALRPMWSILALTVTMPLYYLRFVMDAMGHTVWFDYGVIWLEFVPIWLLLAWELWHRHRRANNNNPPEEASPCIAVGG